MTSVNPLEVTRLSLVADTPQLRIPDTSSLETIGHFRVFFLMGHPDMLMKPNYLDKAISWLLCCRMTQVSFGPSNSPVLQTEKHQPSPFDFQEGGV